MGSFVGGGLQWRWHECAAKLPPLWSFCGATLELRDDVAATSAWEGRADPPSQHLGGENKDPPPQVWIEFTGTTRLLFWQSIRILSSVKNTWTGTWKTLPTWPGERNVWRCWNGMCEWRQPVYLRQHADWKCWVLVHAEGRDRGPSRVVCRPIGQNYLH